MPMRKRYKRRNNKSMAYRALKLARKVNSKIEKKFLDTLVTDASVTNLGTGPIFLNNPAQGLTDSERIGDQITCLSFRFRGLISRDNSSAAAIRLIFIWDKRNTIGDIGELLVDSGTEESLVSEYVHDKRSDYIVLHDHMYNISDSWKNKTVFKVSKKLNKKTGFRNGSINYEYGVLKLFMISDVSDGAQNAPNSNLYIRTFYADG